MLNEICAETHNYFCEPKNIKHGKWTIKDGSIEPLDFLSDGQYFRIVGSVFNDGVYKYPDLALIDETFEGQIWPMNVPQAVLKLADEIKDWLNSADVQAAINSPYQSESFGGYSYSKMIGTRNATATCWQDQFAARLKPYRKLREVY